MRPEMKPKLLLEFSKRTITKLSTIDLGKIKGGSVPTPPTVKNGTISCLSCGSARSTCGTVGC